MVPSRLETLLEGVALAPARWELMKAGLERFERWMQDQLIFGLATLELNPLEALEPIAARLSDDQLPGPAAAVRGWIGKVGQQADWAEIVLADFGYWNLLLNMLLQPERLEKETFAGLAFTFGHRLQSARLESLGQRVADWWTCVGMEEGNEEALYFRKIHWRGTQADHAGAQLIFNFGAPVSPSALEVGVQGHFEMLVYPDGLPGRLVLPEGVQLAREAATCHRFSDWQAQEEWQIEVVQRQAWRRNFPIALSGLEAQVQSQRTEEGPGYELLLMDENQQAMKMIIDAHLAAGRGNNLWAGAPKPTSAAELLAFVGDEKYTLFGEWSAEKLKLWSCAINGTDTPLHCL